MSLYLDASVLVALFVNDKHSTAAEAVIKNESNLIISDFAAAEFVSAVARRVRKGELSIADAQLAFNALDEWRRRMRENVEIAPADIALSDSFLRRLDLTLRTPDAIHIAAAMRLGAMLATFDIRMKASAEALGVDVVPA